MKLSLCINSVTGKMNPPDAIRLAKKLGYSACEFWQGSNLDAEALDAYKSALDETGLTLAAMGGASGLVDPATRDAFIDNLKKSIANGKKLGTKAYIATTGNEIPGVDRAVQHKSIVDGLKKAAPYIEETGKILALEPLNILVNHKGYYLYLSSECNDILNEVGSPNIKMLFDIYHQQISEGNLISNILAYINNIGHFHVAGNPGRGEPYKGEINYNEIFDAADKAGYKGFAGLEYWAVGDIEESLKECLRLYE